MDYYVPASEAHKKKERSKAKEVRQSGWWRQKLAQGQCYYCEKKFSPSELTMDHKVPVARGGRSTKGNLVTACKQCNTEKRHKTLAETVLEGLSSINK